MRGKSNYTGPTWGSHPLPGERHASSTFSASTVEASSCADGWATYTSGGRLPAWYLAHARFLAALAAKVRGPERPAAKPSTMAATLQRMKKCDVTRGGSIDCKIALRWNSPCSRCGLAGVCVARPWLIGSELLLSPPVSASRWVRGSGCSGATPLSGGHVGPDSGLSASRTSQIFVRDAASLPEPRAIGSYYWTRGRLRRCSTDKSLCEGSADRDQGRAFEDEIKE